MVLDLQKKVKVNINDYSKLTTGKGIFVFEGGDDKTVPPTIKILEGQELKIIVNNLFYTVGLSHFKIILEKSAKLIITEKNNLQIYETLIVEQQENSTFVYQKLYNSSGTSFLSLFQQGNNCKAIIQNIIIGQNIILEIGQKVIQNGKGQKLEHRTKSILLENSNLKVSHFGKSAIESVDCAINQVIKGIILDSYSKFEMEPILEIDSDSSTSNHGASVGQFNEAEIQYIQSRGLSPNQTQKILVDSFLDDYYNKIEPMCVKEKWRD
jgi:uncharacterized protein